MAKLIFFLFVFFLYGGMSKLAKAQPAQGGWCIAKPSTSDDELQSIISWTCGEVDCQIIQSGSPCFEPQSLINHASVVMNLYYQKDGRSPHTCDFGKAGLVTISDPSYGDCKYIFG